MELETTVKREITNETFSVLLKNVYAWMALALGVTGVAAMYVSNNQTILSFMFEHFGLVMGLLVAELLLAVLFTALFNRLSFNVASILFGLYALLTGVSISPIFLLYTQESIALTFFVTAGTFGAMSLFGYFTKKDLSPWGRYLMMGLFGIIIASVVNLFMQSSRLEWITTYVGVVVFVLLTAYDTQKIKNLLVERDELNEGSLKLALLGSFMLYLDFINLFLKLLRLFGKRK
jgi:FtsH-binding integral membrane protein